MAGERTQFFIDWIWRDDSDRSVMPLTNPAIDHIGAAGLNGAFV
jgi:hypothetical protein